ncbi:MAG: ferredoxin [Rhodobacteraceae bacterium]|nr:ferredoxin [Paracoccaceae bacterium]
MTLEGVARSARAHRLDVFGALHPGPEDHAPAGTGTLVLLGPHEPGFWAHVTAEPEFHDGAPDPVDRWSGRVIGALALALGAESLFPFGGPPYHPFIRWALGSGQCWQSPVSLLVHDRAGLMVSYRGALAFKERFDLPSPAPNPCNTCVDRPCLSACPVGALGTEGYDLDVCHAFLDTADGSDCLSNGCAVRRACPVSQAYGRLPTQSAHHMKAFHP